MYLQYSNGILLLVNNELRKITAKQTRSKILFFIELFIWYYFFSISTIFRCSA